MPNHLFPSQIGAEKKIYPVPSGPSRYEAVRQPHISEAGTRPPSEHAQNAEAGASLLPLRKEPGGRGWVRASVIPATNFFRNLITRDYPGLSGIKREAADFCPA